MQEKACKAPIDEGKGTQARKPILMISKTRINDG